MIKKLEINDQKKNQHLIGPERLQYEKQKFALVVIIHGKPNVTGVLEIIINANKGMK